jgi:hypothetical protein
MFAGTFKYLESCGTNLFNTIHMRAHTRKQVRTELSEHRLSSSHTTVLDIQDSMYNPERSKGFTEPRVLLNHIETD